MARMAKVEFFSTITCYDIAILKSDGRIRTTSEFILYLQIYLPIKILANIAVISDHA